MKICTKCKIEKALTEFNKGKYLCRVCQSLAKKLYRERYAHKVLNAKKIFYQKNKEKIKEYGKLWNLKNKDLINKKARERRKKYGNKTILQFNNEKELLKKKAKRNALRKEYKEKLKNNNFIKTELQKFVAQEMYDLARIRKAETGIDWHIDHIEPLSKGGRHAINNLQVVPAVWNLSKGNSNNAVFKLSDWI